METNYQRVAFRKASRSASSSFVNCSASPDGMTDTVPGRMSVMSARARRCSVLGPDGAPQYYDLGHLSVAASTRLGHTILDHEGLPAAFKEIATWAHAPL